MSNADELTMRNSTLSDAVNKLRDIKDRSRDLVLPQRVISMNIDSDLVIESQPSSEINAMLESLDVSNVSSESVQLRYDMTQIASGQLARKLGIPTKYFRKMHEGSDIETGLIADHVNHWLNSDRDKSRLVRTLETPDEDRAGIVRAFLSDRYKIVNNFDVLMTVLDGLKSSNIAVDVDRCDLSNRKLYVTFTFPGIRYQTSIEGMRDLKAGLLVSNSDVGGGKLEIRPRLFVEKCSNGWIVERGTYDAIERTHLGSQMDTGVIDWSRRTQTAEKELLISMTRDAVEQFATDEYWRELVQRIQQQGKETLDHPVDAVRNVTSDLGYSDNEVDDILEHFVDQSNTREVASIPQSMTEYAHTQSSADRQYEIESDAMRALDIAKQFDFRENTN